MSGCCGGGKSKTIKNLKSGEVSESEKQNELDAKKFEEFVKNSKFDKRFQKKLDKCEKEWKEKNGH